MKRDLPKIRERNARIIEAYRTSGDGYIKLAKRFGVTRALVRDAINSHPESDQIHREHEEAAAEENEGLTRKIYRDYMDGVSVREICEMYGIADRTIYRYITNIALQRKKPERKKSDGEGVEKLEPYEKQQILADFDAGEKVGKIAKFFGVGTQTILKVIEHRLHEIWLNGESVGLIAKRIGINRDTTGKIIQNISIGLREIRNERYKIISEGFAAGMSDEQIAERENLPLDFVRNVTRAFNKPRPNPWEIRIPLPEHKIRGNGNPQLRQFNDDEITLDLNPPEYSRYLEVRNRRALIESEIVQNKFDTVPAIILNTYSSTVKTHNGSPF